MDNINGIWQGENAAAAISDELSVFFFRIEPKLIGCVLKHEQQGVIGTVYGIGENFDAHAIYRAVDRENGKVYCNSDDERLLLHDKNSVRFDGEKQKLIYKLYDGTSYELVQAESFPDDLFDRNNENTEQLPIAKKMAKWNIEKYCRFYNDNLQMSLTSPKYSVCFNIGEKDNFLYCRMGQNGYCEKGWAMLSTVCIRMNESRMLEDNLSALNDYKPDEGCFVKDGCAFPSDGGWYWSLKEVTNDAVYLNGCGGATYEILKN